MSKNSLFYTLIAIILFAFLFGFVPLLRIINTPSDPENSVVFGLSIYRLFLISCVLIIQSLLLAFGLKVARRRAAWNMELKMGKYDNGLKFLAVLTPVVSITALIFSLTINLLAATSDQYVYDVVAQRLSPLTNWIAATAILTLLLLLAQRGRVLQAAVKTNKKLICYFMGILSFFTVLWIIIWQTRLGLEKSFSGSWGMPTVPLLEWQIWLSIILCAIFIYISSHGPIEKMLLKRKLLRIVRSDWFWVVLIWLIAFTVWALQPIIPGFFATAGRPPNYEIYPFSDGLTYDQYAQSALAGQGFHHGHIMARPIYVTFLTLAHALLGQDYNTIILFQTLFLALFPAVLYLIGKELHSRPAGLMVAMLAILRELTSIRSAPFTSNISNSKLYFSELPTAMGIAVFILLCIRWLKDPAKHKLYALLAGGVIGLSMLIRTQVVFIVPFVLLLAVIYQRSALTNILKGSLLLCLGLCLAIAPWLYRNYRLTGHIVFDHPVSQTQMLAARYANFEEKIKIPQLEGEDDGAYTKRLYRITFSSVKANPGKTLLAVSDYFINNEIYNLLVLPVRDELQNVSSLVWPEHAFWEDWGDGLLKDQSVLLFVNLAIIALGIAAAVKKNVWLGLLPLAVNLSYNLSTSIFRSSGGRFLLPVDWVAYFYYATGVIVLVSAYLNVMGLISRQLTEEKTRIELTKPRLKMEQPGVVLFSGLLILLLGASIPITENAFPDRFPEQSQTSLIQELIDLDGFEEAGIDASELESLIVDEELQIVKGRVVYPRYYEQGEIEPNTNKIGYARPRDARLVFFFTGKSQHVVVMRMEMPPDYLPHAADVLLMGYLDEGYFNGLLIGLLESPQAVYVSGEGLLAEHH